MVARVFTSSTDLESTIASYRDTLRLLLNYVEQQTRRRSSQQVLEDWDAPPILRFLEHLETQRANTARSRNLRLTAIHTFMHFVAQQAPEVLALTVRVLAIPVKRFERPLLGYLSQLKIQAILRAPPSTTASGRRDRILFELMYNTGARVSEIATLNRQDIQLQPARVVQLQGKGRKYGKMVDKAVMSGKIQVARIKSRRQTRRMFQHAALEVVDHDLGGGVE